MEKKIVTSQEFMNSINLNKEYKVLKQVAKKFEINTHHRSIYSAMNFEGMFHRYFTNKADGHKGQYIEAIKTDKDYNSVIHKMMDFVKAVNTAYEENKVDAKCSLLTANQGSIIVGIRLDYNRFISKEWLDANKENN